jgi:alpha-1,3-rhamnosyltransferase
MKKIQGPLVSILVPSYNHEKYVIECLESIRRLDYPRLELVVSDDCSSDATFALVENWLRQNQQRFERAVAVRQETNLGIVRNFQFLFDHAQGSYVAYIASDDVFLETAISCRITILEENHRIDAIFGDAQKISSTGDLLQEKSFPADIAKEMSTKRLLLPSLVLNAFVPGPVMMLRRSALLEGGSVGRLPVKLITEDWYIYLQLAVAGKLMYLDETVAKYRIMESSASRSPTQQKAMLEAIVQVYSLFRGRMVGLSRLMIEVRIARFRLDLNITGSLSFRIKRAVLNRALRFLKSTVSVLASSFS